MVTRYLTYINISDILASPLAVNDGTRAIIIGRQVTCRSIFAATGE